MSVEEKMVRITCIDCPHLTATADAAGGGTYRCGRVNAIKGEWGHWVKEADEPVPYDDCEAWLKTLTEDSQ